MHFRKMFAMTFLVITPSALLASSKNIAIRPEDRDALKTWCREKLDSDGITSHQRELISSLERSLRCELFTQDGVNSIIHDLGPSFTNDLARYLREPDTDAAPQTHANDKRPGAIYFFGSQEDSLQRTGKNILSTQVTRDAWRISIDNYRAAYPDHISINQELEEIRRSLENPSATDDMITNQIKNFCMLYPRVGQDVFPGFLQLSVRDGADLKSMLHRYFKLPK